MAPAGFAARLLVGSNAAIRGNVDRSFSEVGSTRARLIPAPPARPVTKNAGGPPIGASMAAKTKSEVNGPVGEGNRP